MIILDFTELKCQSAENKEAWFIEYCWYVKYFILKVIVNKNWCTYFVRSWVYYVNQRTKTHYILLTINLMWFKPLFEYFLSNKTQSFQYKNKVVWRNIHEMSIKLSLFLYLFLKIITNIYQKSQDYIWLLKYSSK